MYLMTEPPAKPKEGEMNIDRKYERLAVNPCKIGSVYTENDGIFFNAID